MPPSLQIDNASITTWEDLDANVKRSALRFARDSAESDPYMHVSMGNAANPVRITNIATPTSSTDVTNKAYVDAAIQGLTIKSPVRAVAVTNAALATAYSAGSVVDGVTLATGDRVLLTAQTDARENGVWVVGAGAPTRPADMPADGAFSASGIYVFVDEGTVYRDRSFVCTSNRGSATVGTDNLEWVQFGARPSAYQGFGLSLGTANALDVNASVIPVLANNQTFTGNNTFTGTVTVNNTVSVSSTVSAPKVTNLVTASISGSQDAVNVEYLQTQITNNVNGQQSKSAAITAAVANLDLTALKSGDTVGGVVVATGDRILLVAQTNAVQNGLYVVPATATASPARTSDMAVGSRTFGAVVAVSRGDLPVQSRLYVCASPASTDVVGTDPLVFVPLGHSISALAGTALYANPTNIGLDVRTDNSTIETDTATNNLRLKDLGITNAKIADSTIANGKLVNPQVNVKVVRGLQRTSTNGTTTTAPATDTTSAADYGLTIPLGTNIGIQPDFTVIPDLAASNTFTNNNNFGGTVTITNSTASLSRTSGALVVGGGLGVAGDVYCSNTYNMSDLRLKDKVTPIENALDSVCQVNGVTFEWNESIPELKGQPSVGVIAQDVLTPMPLLVSHNLQTDLYAVEYTKMVPYLVEAIKTLKRKVDDLEDALQSAVPVKRPHPEEVVATP